MTTNPTIWVHPFDDLDRVETRLGDDWEAVRGLLGGKGANLADMTRLGIPVPPGFTVTTEACLAWLSADGHAPPDLWAQVEGALSGVEGATGRRFGDPDEPLLLSVRSGARFSMPGMMDTVLDLGLNDETAKGLIGQTGDERFVWDAYRRLIQMFGTVVLGLRDELFEHEITMARRRRDVTDDSGLTAEDLHGLVQRFKSIATGFPTEPVEQLRMAIEAVFASWNGRRAHDYRDAAGIPHDLGTAVNVQAMVFGNLGEGSATGVAMTRSGATGEPGLEGDFLLNAQGEDVVSGTRDTRPIDELAGVLPEPHAQLTTIASTLEQHHRNMQDLEFTVERGRLWLLQTRDGKRTARAAVRIAVDMAEEGLITRDEAVRRVTTAQVEAFLHPQLDPAGRAAAEAEDRQLTTGLAVAPGAAVGVVAFDPDTAARWHDEGRDVVLVRPETKPDDVHGMLAAKGLLTSRGGRTSHAALVARQFGIPAVVGASDMEVDVIAGTATVGNRIVHEGDLLTVDGSTGAVYTGAVRTLVPDLDDRWLSALLGWADELRTLGVQANADTPRDAELARRWGAEGIGLCRTEHMFFAAERLPVVQRMIMATTTPERAEALSELLPLQREDFVGLMREMTGLPVIIRLLDPPLHEFLPSQQELASRMADAKLRLRGARDMAEVDALLAQLREDEGISGRVEALAEANPMLGLRGVRLAVMHPEILRMQVRAVAEAAAQVVEEGLDPRPRIMVPLVVSAEELAHIREMITDELSAVRDEVTGDLPEIPIGTMIETPRAALVAADLAVHADFMSFGTNDLTQTTYAISRDDAERGFLLRYVERGLVTANPFSTLDPDGVGRLVALAVDEGRQVDPELSAGICGEHGADPATISWCQGAGLNYVSCSPPRVPVARLAAAHAALRTD